MLFLIDATFQNILNPKLFSFKLVTAAALNVTVAEDIASLKSGSYIKLDYFLFSLLGF